MQTNDDLVGKTFRNGEDGTRLFKVKEVDREYPSLVAYEEPSTGISGIMLADFVRPHLVQ